MNELCNEIVCAEKFKNVEKDIEQMKVQVTKLEERLGNNEKTVSQIDTQLSIKLIQLEAKLDVHTKVVGDKVDNLAKEVEKKMDEYFLPNNKSNTTPVAPPATDTFKDWLTKFGMRLFEYGIYGGILYAIAKGLNLF